MCGIFWIVYDEMYQYLEALYNSVNQLLSNDQSMKLQYSA